MLKKFVKTSIILFILINFLLSSHLIYADDISFHEEENIDINQIIETNAQENNLPNINSRSAVVIDRNSSKILFGKEENSIRKMASTTKIMTCLLTIENCNLTDIVEISKKSASTGGSRLGLKTGDKISVNDLLYGLMLCSGNDTAVALAEHISGSVENFSILMNNKAKELGLVNTNFETPHGLDSANHYTTAYELALLTNYALNNETFSKIVGTKNYIVNINGNQKQISNSNELLGNLQGVYGVKTGFTNGANRCLVTACKRDNLDIICVVLGADTKNFRTKDSVKLIEYSFQNFIPVNIQELLDKKFEEYKNNNLSNLKIIKGKTKNYSVKLLPLKNKIIPIEKNLAKDINFSIDYNLTFNAPIDNNTIIGNIKIFSGTQQISSTDILFDCTIEKKVFSDYFIDFFKYYKNLNFNININQKTSY